MARRAATGPVSFAAKVYNNEGDVPGKVTLYGKSDTHGEVVLILSRTKCFFGQASGQNAFVWEGSGYAAPAAPKTQVSVADFVTRMKSAAASPVIDSPVSYKNTWKCTLVFEADGQPKVIFVRAIASYATIALESSAAGWRYSIKRVGKWFAGEKLIVGKSWSEFGVALESGLREALALVQEACGTRDTRRRTRLDPDFAAAHPEKPAPSTPEPTDRFASGPKVPKGFEEILRWDSASSRWLVAVINGGGRLAYKPFATEVDPGASTAATKLAKAIRSAWEGGKQPQGLELPQSAAPAGGGSRGPRKTAFKVAREIATKGNGAGGALVQQHGGTVTWQGTGVNVYVFADGSAIANASGSWTVVKLNRGRWKAVGLQDGKVLDGGPAWDPREVKASTPRAARPAAAPKQPAEPRQAAAPRTRTPRAAAPAPVAVDEPPVDAAKDAALMSGIAAQLRLQLGLGGGGGAAPAQVQALRTSNGRFGANYRN